VRFYVHAPSAGTAPPTTGAALAPGLTRTYAGWSSRGRIFGQPGTMPIYIPDPAGMPDEGVVALASVGTFYTRAAPNFIYPPIYFENDAPDNKQVKSVAAFSDNQMPVPASRPPNTLVFSPYIPRHGGQRQVYQPQAIQKWRAGAGTIMGTPRQ
jgi:hypothetical protein